MVALDKPRGRNRFVPPLTPTALDNLPIHERRTWIIPAVLDTNRDPEPDPIPGPRLIRDPRPIPELRLVTEPNPVPGSRLIRDPRPIPELRLVTEPNPVRNQSPDPGSIPDTKLVKGTVNEPGGYNLIALPASLATLDNLPIYEQLTWIIPAVRDKGQKTGAGPQGANVEGYVSQIRGLVKSSGIYALSSLASPLISLVLAPFLTHHLSSTDYGALAILNTLIVLVAGVTQLGLNAAFFRAYGYDYESQRDRLDVLSTFLVLLVLASCPAVIAIIVAAPSVAVFLLNVSTLASSVRVAALVDVRK